MCGTNPLQWLQTPTEVLTEITGGLPLQSARVGNLQPQTEYCYTACVTDLTAGTDEFCGNVVHFTTPPPPAVQTKSLYNVGACVPFIIKYRCFGGSISGRAENIITYIHPTS